MTLPATLASARRMLRRLAEPLIAELPLVVVNEIDRPGRLDPAHDPMRPRIAVMEHTGPTTVRVMRDPHASEGASAHAVDIDMYLLDAAQIRAKMQEALDEVADLLRADATIVAAGGDPLRPGPQWHTGDAFMLAAAAHWGWTPEQLVAPAEIVMADGTTAILRNEDHIMTTLLTGERDGASVHCARILARRHMACGQLSICRPEDKTIIAQYSDHDRPAVRFTKIVLPDTVMIAIEGRRIGELVDDARLGPIRDLVITRGTNTNSGITLDVEGERTWMDGRGKA